MNINACLIKHLDIDIDLSTNIDHRRLKSYISQWPIHFFQAILFVKKHPHKTFSFIIPNGDGKLMFLISKKKKLCILFKKYRSCSIKDKFKVLLKKVDAEIVEDQTNDYKIKKDFSSDFLDMLKNENVDLLLKEL